MQESDWKAFRTLVPMLRERYLKSRNQEIIAILADLKRNETERFWDAHERMKDIARVLRDCLDNHSRSNLYFALMLMRNHGMLLDEDLHHFTPETAAELRSKSGGNAGN